MLQLANSRGPGNVHQAKIVALYLQFFISYQQSAQCDLLESSECRLNELNETAKLHQFNGNRVSKKAHFHNTSRTLQEVNQLSSLTARVVFKKLHGKSQH